MNARPYAWPCHLPTVTYVIMYNCIYEGMIYAVHVYNEMLMIIIIINRWPSMIDAGHAVRVSKTVIRLLVEVSTLAVC